MHVRQTRLLLTPLLASLLALGSLATPAGAQEPQPSNTPAGSSAPSHEPTPEPSSEPSNEPSNEPSSAPTAEPSSAPTAEPSSTPSTTTTADPTTEAEASWSAPSEPSSEQTADPAVNSPSGAPEASADVVLPTFDCGSLGLAAGCASVVPPATLVAFAQSLATACTGSAGACASATQAVNGALGLAVNCVGAALAESGADLSLSGDPSAGVALDCRGAARMALGSAALVSDAANDCRAEHTPACATVFDAARVALDRARGCVAGALSHTTLRLSSTTGTDPGCGNAVYALLGVAEQVSSMASNCTRGMDICASILPVAQYARDNLTSCVSSLVVPVTGTDLTMLDSKGSLNCYAALDQVNLALWRLTGSLPRVVPYSMSPLPDCTIVFGAWGMQGDMMLTLVPSCQPRLYHTQVKSPAFAVSGLDDGPACEYEEHINPGTPYTDSFIVEGSVGFENDGGSNQQYVAKWSTAIRDKSSISGTIEAEAKVAIFGKVKSSVATNIEEEMTRSFEDGIAINVGPYIYSVTEFGVGRRAIPGEITYRFDDCSTDTRNWTLYAPFTITYRVQERKIPH